jgi:hypothetical protein
LVQAKLNALGVDPLAATTKSNEAAK